MTPPTTTERTRAYVCLGSNIRPAMHLPLAVERLVERQTVVATSRVFESEAKGTAGAPRFLNAAVALDTDLAPHALKLDVLRPLEAELGRVRTTNPNAPRTIDLDLVLFGQLVVDDPDGGLILPDPDILECAHVALPLADLAPDLCHPVTGENLLTIAHRLSGQSDIRAVPEPRLPFSSTRSGSG